MKRTLHHFLCAAVTSVAILCFGASVCGQEAPPPPTKPANPDPRESNITQGDDDAALSNLPKGASISDEIARNRIVDIPRPERVAVFPDDPESAWWEINPRYAFLRANREQKPLMLLFTSSENTLAMKLSEQVFSTKSFNNFVKENLVICYLNYPANITDAPQIMRDWKKKFNVRGYPNVLFFNPQGEVNSHIRGYRSDRPVDYFNELKAKVAPVLAEIRERKSQLSRFGYRDWKGGRNDSVTVFAKFLRRDSELVTLQGTKKSERWTIALETLSEEDRAVAESFPPIEEVLGAKKPQSK